MKNNDLSQQVAAFSRHIDDNNVEEVAKEARTVMKKLLDAQEQAKKYNLQENLTGEEETNYEIVK